MQNYNFDLDLESKNTMSVIISWISDNAKVLEFGPANGRLTKYLKFNKQCRVTIVEIDSEAGKEAAQYAETAYVGSAEGDICSFCWKNDSDKYDYIIFADVLEHLLDPKKVLDECRHVLKENGEILISIPNIAHNSILIDLFMDKFNYGDTGLLDRTHIHFFTYHSFVEMIDALKYRIVKQDAVYSRTGWNEIENSYMDVSFRAECELKNRRCGSVYQYLFSVKEERGDHAYRYYDIENLEEKAEVEKEAACYLFQEDKMHPVERISSNYVLKSENKVHFVINRNVRRIRLDLVEESVLIYLKSVVYKCAGEEKMAELVEHNAEYAVNNLYLFVKEDPWFVAETGSGHLRVEYIEAEFGILDLRMSYDLKYNYSRLFENFIAFMKDNEPAGQYMNKYLFHSMNEEYERELKEAEQYQGHLERDIKVLKKALEEAEKYQEHLEYDIKTLQQEHLRMKEESEAFAEHLQADIRRLKDELSKVLLKKEARIF